jgi:hypothetical protein
VRSCITVLLSMIFVSGCLAHNGRCWVKGDIKFKGDKRLSNKRIFTRLQIGVPCKSNQSLPEICIELQDGTVIALCDIDIKFLEKNTTSVPRINFDQQNRDIYSCTWPDDVKVFKGSSYYFAINQDRLFGLWSDYCTGILWNRDKTIRLSFPLSENDLQDLFGRPDRIYDYVRGGF